MDYKQETIDKIREVHDFGISDKKLEHLYRMYSSANYSASWIAPCPKTFKHFCEWTNMTPLQEVIAMPESDFE